MFENCIEKKDGYFSYDVKVKEGLMGKVPSKEILKPGQIIEVRYDGLIDSDTEAGKTFRFPSLFRIRHDLKIPNSVGDKIETK